MLKGTLIHPDIMAALALCGHGDKVLIADGNYPLDSRSRGCGDGLSGAYPPESPPSPTFWPPSRAWSTLQKAEVMDPADGTTPDIFWGVPVHAGRHGAGQAGPL